MTLPETDQAPYPVFAEAWPAVELFHAADTQWRRAGMDGVPVALDYAGVAAAAAALGVEMTPELLGDLKVIEAAALAEIHKRWGKT